jgi:hypothetical protein
VLAPERRGKQVYQIEKAGCSVQRIRSLEQLLVEEPCAKYLEGKWRMHVLQVACNLDPLTLNSTELNGYPCRGIVVAIVVNNDTEKVERSRKHENQPQQRTTQISLNRTHRVRHQTNTRKNR